MNLYDAASAPCHRISANDSVKLALVQEPATAEHPSVSFEVWEPGGAQPLNFHPRSVETFWFLCGHGVAECDGVETEVRAGQLLVLPPGSVHRIRNTGASRLYAVTTMTPDDGFADLITQGPTDHLDADDLAVLRGVL